MYPRVIQVEPTTRCNFSCVYCVRNFWDHENFVDMEFSLYKRLVDESAGRIERLVLYGIGEPFVHPLFQEMIRYAGETLGNGVEIATVTNGSLATPNAVEKAFSNGLTKLAFSVDTTDLAKLARLRRGLRPDIVMANLKAASAIKEEHGAKLGLSIVLMRTNYRDLVDVVRLAAGLSIDFIIVSHVVPYVREMAKWAAYTLVSGKVVQKAGAHAQVLRNIARKAVYEEFRLIYGAAGRGEASNTLRGLLRSIGEYSLNTDLLEEAVGSMPLFQDIEAVFRKAEDIARENEIELTLPAVWTDARRRACPYIVEKAAFVTAMGEVAPCMEFAHSHPVFINNHYKQVIKLVFGNLREKTMEEIWNTPEYVEFRKTREMMSTEIPWCADCPFVTKNCWYVKSTENDCYGNMWTCNECPYSSGTAQCLL